MNIVFEEFLQSVEERERGFVEELHEFLSENGCECNIKQAKSGFVVSYVRNKQTLMNYVQRKTGTKARIYAANIGSYQEILNTLPPKMKSGIVKAPPCKRLLDPSACNPKCSMGYIFEMDGVLYKKCRISAFMFTLSEENNGFIRTFLEKELGV
ncbi:MAG: hypothetical protein K2N06_12190 [Oscillospiraceae bacterium]|nr:hypothetical protein [Oscillospiraceae bacterium]